MVENSPRKSDLMLEGIFNLVHPKKCEITDKKLRHIEFLDFFEDGTKSKIISEIMQLLSILVI